MSHSNQQAALAHASNMSWLMQWGLFETISALDSQAFITRTAAELLFDGYDDTLLSVADMMNEDENAPPMDKFGWFYQVSYSTPLFTTS